MKGKKKKKMNGRKCTSSRPIRVKTGDANFYHTLVGRGGGVVERL